MRTKRTLQTLFLTTSIPAVTAATVWRKSAISVQAFQLDISVATQPLTTISQQSYAVTYFSIATRPQNVRITSIQLQYFSYSNIRHRNSSRRSWYMKNAVFFSMVY
ncbi:hypothetical protein Tcan_00916, partial [Toxocara canis]